MLLASSCIRDAREECVFPLRLHFTYLYNREKTDLFAEEVDCVLLFLYDSDTGRHVASARAETADLDDGNTYTWPVPPGKYTLVCWGGARARHTVDAGTSLSEHILAIDGPGEGIPQMREHIWHRAVTDVLVNGDVTPVYEVDLHKLSNDLTVTVACTHGTVLPAASDARVAISNGRYDALGENTARTPTVYLPYTAADDAMCVCTHDFTLLQLDKNDDSRLSVSLPGYGQPVYDGPLSSLLAQQPRADLDLDDEWRLNFDVTPGPDGACAVAVSVNGWHIINYNVILR